MKNWQNDRTLDESIDLLVDDELTEQEYHDLIQELDGAEDGWRRCALAFLEERAWTGSVGMGAEGAQSVATESVGTGARINGQSGEEAQPVAARSPVSPDRAARQGQSHNAGSNEVGAGMFWWFAIAAAVAFLVGRSSVAPGISPTGDRVPAGDRRSVAEDSDSDGSGWVDQHLANAGDSNAGANDRIYPTSLHVEGDGDQPGFVLPVADFDGQATDWTRQPPPIPRGVQQAIQRMGGEIEREYFFAPAELENGQHVVVPVEELHIRPASHRRVY